MVRWLTGITGLRQRSPKQWDNLALICGLNDLNVFALALLNQISILRQAPPSRLYAGSWDRHTRRIVAARSRGEKDDRALLGLQL